MEEWDVDLLVVLTWIYNLRHEHGFECVLIFMMVLRSKHKRLKRMLIWQYKICKFFFGGGYVKPLFQVKTTVMVKNENTLIQLLLWCVPCSEEYVLSLEKGAYHENLHILYCIKLALFLIFYAFGSHTHTHTHTHTQNHTVTFGLEYDSMRAHFRCVFLIIFIMVFACLEVTLCIWQDVKSIYLLNLGYEKS